MEVFSVDITAPSSSFHITSLISGHQLTFTVPPISTVLGMINAAAGRYLSHDNLQLGYYFEYGAKAADLQSIWCRESGGSGQLTNSSKLNVISREFLFKTFIRIYSPNERIINYFQEPAYSLTIGRGDMARVDIKSIGRRNLVSIQNADKICGQIVPFVGNYLPGRIHAMHTYFSNTIPRENLGTQPFSILDHQDSVKSKLTAYRDLIREREVDIFFHEIHNV
jgi:CRISPR-associated protein Cas5t